eukprot:5168360-Pleurochrysis_carterae.AAC.1
MAALQPRADRAEFGGNGTKGGRRRGRARRHSVRGEAMSRAVNTRHPRWRRPRLVQSSCEGSGR